MIGKDDAKNAYVVFPPLEKNDYPTTFFVPLTSNEELRDFVTTHKGNLINKSGIKVRFQQLANEDVYTIFGPHYMGLENDPRTPKVRNKMREMSALLAVKNELNGDRQFHLNVMIHPHVTNEILVHKENPNAESATAFVCESTYAPLTEDADNLKDKAMKFETMAKSYAEFREVSHIVPVLAGNKWMPDTLQRVKVYGMWTVRTGGWKYQVVREFCTLSRRIII